VCVCVCVCVCVFVCVCVQYGQSVLPHDGGLAGGALSNVRADSDNRGMLDKVPAAKNNGNWMQGLGAGA
jgi:hypothetical protein